MKVLLFHPTLLPPKDYGGVERVVLWLAKGLLERGHDVMIAAHQGSELPPGVRLLPMNPNESGECSLLGRIPAGTDVIHFMAPVSEDYLGELPCPGLVTVHGNGKPGEVYPKNSVFLTRDHAVRHGRDAFVWNGLDPDELLFDPARKGKDFLFLSRTGWRVKNVRGAIRMCRQAGVRLQVAGGHRPWRVRLASRIRSDRVTWVGPVNGERKADLLASAKALVFPVLWDEPFGLVVVEALMSGTPVLGMRRGSLPELVPETVGALMSGEDDENWQKWLSMERLPWEPEACRAWALRNFHYRRMAEDYEKVYRKLSAGEEL